ncbi:DUF7018 domain-containing (lipo)protein [Bacillus pseudomycoides]|uniref:DUF7018 domain-containing (lipo)protein n=1 Tax=Bacillus pseudomycoides TaxID=64104 RepID=UPI0001A14A7D|nr:hypothetical protein [Bacillus pseudomycoides]EEM01585.1 hypothetical protein bmyco0002_61250 [Bacillus pseudomycoides]PFY89845.1 hypothetical protein COL53_18730 [Bacillus pseudomycoides]PGC27739.1 hypothetical protein COM18_30595 [Bacillus pseudomycoides]
MGRKILVFVIIVPALFFALAGAIASLGTGETSVVARVMSIAVPILLLTWIIKRYTNKKKKSNNIAVSERVFETDEEGRLTSKTDYVLKVQNISMVWVQAQNKFSDLEKKDPTFLNTHDELKQVVSEMKSANKKLREIKPPVEYDNLQSELSQSLYTFDKGLDIMVEGFTTLDETKINKSGELIDEGSDGLMESLGVILSLTKS